MTDFSRIRTLIVVVEGKQVDDYLDYHYGNVDDK